MLRMGYAACKAGALPAGLHARADSVIVKDCSRISMPSEHLPSKQVVSRRGLCGHAAQAIPLSSAHAPEFKYTVFDGPSSLAAPGAKLAKSLRHFP